MLVWCCHPAAFVGWANNCFPQSLALFGHRLDVRKRFVQSLLSLVTPTVVTSNSFDYLVYTRGLCHLGYGVTQTTALFCGLLFRRLRLFL